uniref:stalk-specific protein StpX n=1 Tax=uncultured Caulobacter sp. TaxID=158749 RepID=UPI0025D1DC60|nr:stalk-specific protein X [uncultured Caulobacter sp.]
MFGRNVRLAALATTAAGALLLAGCSAGDQANAPPPRSDYQQADASTPDLMGAAPAPDASQAQDGLLGGPAAATGDTSVSSQPLPPPPARNAHLKTWRRPDGTLVTAMRPIANPKGSSRHEQRPAAKPHRVYASIPAASHPAPVAQKPVAQHPVAKPPVVAKPVAPKAVAPAPAPVQAAKPVVPAAPLNKPPVVAATPVVPVTPAPTASKSATKLEKLQAAVAPEATNGAVLVAGESLGKNQPGQVTLSLPATLGDLIKQEAAKLGLGKAAKKTSAYAELSGEGYEVTPNGRQTAVVKPGEPTTFAWQVKPGPDANGQLKSDFGVELNGDKEPQGFALGTISKRVAALPEKVKKGFGQLDLGALNGNISLPGLGSVPIKTALGVALVLLALIILVGVSRSAAASRRRAERQRKYRTLTDYGRNEMEFEDAKPASAHVSYVNPFVAATGGAAVGAAAASAMSHQDDHGRGHDDHGHGDHGHNDAQADHGHADHGDADHGHADHGHDLHAEAHPEPHAPAEHVSYANPFMANTSHDDHGHGAQAADHGHGHDDHPAPADHGHAAPGHDDHPGDHGQDAHDAHHAPQAAKEPEHAH